MVISGKSTKVRYVLRCVRVSLYLSFFFSLSLLCYCKYSNITCRWTPMHLRRGINPTQISKYNLLQEIILMRFASKLWHNVMWNIKLSETYGDVLSTKGKIHIRWNITSKDNLCCSYVIVCAKLCKQKNFLNTILYF